MPQQKTTAAMDKRGKQTERKASDKKINREEQNGEREKGKTH